VRQRPALRWSCRGAVLAWSVVLLSRAPSLDLEPKPAPEPATAVVRPVAQKPPEVARPETEPAAEPEPAPEPVQPGPSPRRVSASDFAAGASLLDGGGDFPVLSFSYEDFPSFGAYARAMGALGARFVVVRNRQIVGALELESAAVTEAGPAAGFSPRARDYTGEPGLAPLARRARQRFGSGAVVMMLVPRALDAGLFGGLARLLAERGEPHQGLSEIRGRYERAPGGGVRLRVEQALRRDGTPVGVQALFDLGRIAGGTAS
jgi:hypothetical protein